MRIIQLAKTAGECKSAGIACMAATWMLAAVPAMVASPAMAQDGAAQSGAAQTVYARNGLSGTTATDSAAQGEERSGVARPDPKPITVMPYSDSDTAPSIASGNRSGNAPGSAPIMESIQPVKPSAASVETGHRTYTPDAAPKLTTRSVVAKSNDTVANDHYATANGKDAVQFNPDAEIVTEETAGRDGRKLLSDVAAKDDVDAGIVTQVPSRPGEVPDGTLVKVKLHEDLSSLTTKPGTSFTAEVSEPILRNGQVVVPTGSLLEGRVTWVRGGKRIGGAAAIHLDPRTITLPDGSQYILRARVIDTDRWDDTKVDNEGTILRKDHGQATAATISLSAGGGMAAGAVVGGLPGALVGAGVGAGVSTVVWARQDRQADLPKDLGIIFSLTEPMRITPMSAQMTRPVVGAVDAK